MLFVQTPYIMVEQAGRAKRSVCCRLLGAYFDKLLPASVYGKDHPEYYSYFKGKRHPGKASQWCLSNPEVFEIVAQRIDSILRQIRIGILCL